MAEFTVPVRHEDGTVPADVRALVEEAERLSAAATPGPWTVDPWKDHGCVIWSDICAIARVVDWLGDPGDLAFVLRARTLLPELAAALRRLAADAERLDWLEQMANEPGGILLHDGTETGRTGLGLRPGTLVRSLRTAIDDARRGQEGTDGAT